MAAAAAPSLPGPWLSGVVSGVLSGDSLVIRSSSGAEKTVLLAGISAPRLARRGDTGVRDEPYAWASREFLRKRAIGAPAVFRVEYMAGPREAASVFVGAGKEKENLSLSCVGNGFARAKAGGQLANAAELNAAEAAARAAGRGIHAKGEPPTRLVNDLTRDAPKAKSFLSFLQRAGRTACVVDFVISPGRIKLLVQRENAEILLALAGVRSPREPEPFAAEALAFCRNHVTQRDCEVQVLDVEPRSGVYTGALFYPAAGGKASLALRLLEEGLAFCTAGADRPQRAAEDAARAALRGLWRDYVEPEPEAAPPTGDSWPCSVTDVPGVPGGALYVQRRGTPEAERVAAGLAAQEACPEGYTPAVGTLCAARFSLDDAWYRAYVLSVAGPAVSVFYCDWGNRESTTPARLAPLDPALAAIPPLAQLAQLAHVRVPAADEDGGLEAAELLAQLTGGGAPFTATVEARGPAARHSPSDTPALAVTLRPEAGGADTPSVNAELLRAGLARLAKPPRGATAAQKAAIAALQPHLDVARAARRGMYALGDPADSDDEALPWGAKGKARGR